jgi:hypothetical protein
MVVVALLGATSIAHAQSGTELGDPEAAQGAWDGEGVVVAEPDPMFRLPASLSARPLTLPGGVARIQQGLVVRTARFRGPMPIMPVGFALGVLDDLEIGFSWPLPYDTTFYALGRFVVDPHVELGGALAITAPTLTDGSSLARVSMPLLLRPSEWMRIDTGLAVELLFASQISPLAIVPITIVLNPHRTFFLGAQGSIEWLDGSRWQGELGGFVGFSVSTERGALMDGRFTVQAYLPQTEFALSFSIAFYPRFWS